MYRVAFSSNVLRQLKNLDKSVSALILGWIRKNLEGCDNPRICGKSLVANHAGQWRYRVGDYRIIAEIVDTEIIILVVNIGHRSDVYK